MDQRQWGNGYGMGMQNLYNVHLSPGVVRLPVRAYIWTLGSRTGRHLSFTYMPPNRSISIYCNSFMSINSALD